MEWLLVDSQVQRHERAHGSCRNDCRADRVRHPFWPGQAARFRNASGPGAVPAALPARAGQKSGAPIARTIAAVVPADW